MQDPSSDFRKEVQGVVKLVLYNVNVISDTVFEVPSSWVSVRRQNFLHPLQVQDFISAAAPDEEPKGGYKRLTWDDILQPSASLPRTLVAYVACVAR